MFDFLRKKGIYEKAIKRKDQIKREKDYEKPAEELAKHFVIAYFNGWIEGSYGDPLLQAFIEQADDKLLGYAAQFFTTGFKDILDTKDKTAEDIEDNQATKERIKLYWQRRLEVIEKKHKVHAIEASELACWIHDCPIERKTALELVKRTMDIRAGKFDDHRDYYKIINALCSYADIDELKVIQCIRIVAELTEGSIHSQFFEKELKKLLESIRDNKKANQALIKEPLGLVDDLAKYHRIYDYRPIFESLYKQLERK